MDTNYLLPHPYIRLFFLFLATIGTGLTIQPIQVFLFYFFFLIPLLIVSKRIKTHLRFLLIGILPIFISFILINILILNSKNGGWDFIILKTIKILVYATIFQYVFYIPATDLLNTLKMWKLKGDGLITVLSSYTVWNEIINKAGKIVTARLARGYIGRRNTVNLAKQLPFVLNPLVIGVMRTSIERAESWHQKDIITLTQNIKVSKSNYSATFNLGILIVAICYLLLGIYSRFYFT